MHRFSEWFVFPSGMPTKILYALSKQLRMINSKRCVTKEVPWPILKYNYNIRLETDENRRKHEQCNIYQ
jgi:hypothetical protein